ncbi:hypothetical protein KJ359_011666 [Pestalotiopsis sp. 9143b]|nr:hypothetical protein KJ359_011666 [Pestalotiopsis sp. 9143b]
MKPNDGPHQGTQRRRRGQYRDFSAYRRDMQAEVAALTDRLAALTLDKDATIRGLEELVSKQEKEMSELEELVSKQEKEMSELQEKFDKGLHKTNMKEPEPKKQATDGRNNMEAREKTKDDKIAVLLSMLEKENEKALERKAELHLAQTKIQNASATITRQASEIKATKRAKKHGDEKAKAIISHQAYELESIKRAKQQDNEKHRNFQTKSQDPGETTESQEEPQLSEVPRPITNLHAKQDESQQPQKDNSEVAREFEALRKAYDELVVENRRRKASTKNLGWQLKSAKRQLKKQRAISREFCAKEAEMNKESGVDACREEYDQLRARLASLEHTISERDETIQGLKMDTR